MLVFLAAVYTNYSSHIVDAEGIEPVDEFIAGPRAGKLILGFEKVEWPDRRMLKLVNKY
jgi:unspecific monooxygenase